MLLNIWTGRAGSGKSGRVLERIRELGDGSAQILLVPEHASHQAEVDLCRVCGDAASRHAEVLSFRRLSDRVLGLTGGLAEISLDAGGKLLTLQRCVTELAPSLAVYRRPSRKAAFLSQLLDLFDELRSYEVSPETLTAQAGEMSGATREKLLDLGLLYGAYEARLRSGGRDVRDRMSRLRDSLEASGYVRDKDLFLDGFTYFNTQERSVLEICLRQARSVTVTLPGERDSREEIFESTLKTMEQLLRMARRTGCPVKAVELRSEPAGALGHLERYFFGDLRPYDGDAASVRVREASNALSEVEQTAAEIVRLTASGAARYRDIAVTARNLDAYAGSLSAVFARWGIPAYLSRRTDILEKPAVSLLTGVLSAVSNGYEYEDMFQYLKTGLAGLDPQACDELENYVLKWEIHGGMWLRDTDWTEDPDGYGAPQNEARLRRVQARLERINALRRRVRAPLAELAENLRAGKTARQKADALYTFMERLSLQETLEARMRRQAADGRLQEAEETAQLWEILCGVLDQFVEILGDEPLDTETFSNLFRQVVTQYSVGTIPASLDQVSVAEMTRNDRQRTKYVFLLGANDHVLPAVGQSGGILNEDDREALAVRGIELAPTGMEQMGMELQTLYAALSRPTDGLFVSYPVSDASGAELRPAFVVERLRALFPDLRVEREDPDRAYRLTAPVPALEAAGQDPGGPLWTYLAGQEKYAGALAAMERAAALRRGSLSPNAVRALYGGRIAMSASRLERLRTCHFAYFMQFGLRAQPRTPAAFDAPQIGSFLHYILENVAQDVLVMGGFAQVEENVVQERTEFYIRKFADERLNSLTGKTARFRYLFRRLRTTARAVVDEAAAELRHSDFQPRAFELSFGDGQTLPAVSIPEKDPLLRVGGRADRVDGWVKDGKLYLRVVDYKSGRKKFDLSAVRMGLDIQMLLYLFALQKTGKDHFGQEIEPAGVLYLPARDEFLTAGRNVTPEQLEAMRRKEYRRTGLVLSDPEVLRAMEHEALTEPHFLPLRVSRDGSVSGDLATAAQLGKLGLYVEKLLGQIAEELRRGVIDADPCCHSEEDSPCRYCDWAAACAFQDGRDTDHLRFLLPVSREEFWEEIEAET